VTFRCHSRKGGTGGVGDGGKFQVIEKDLGGHSVNNNKITKTHAVHALV